MFQPYLLNDNRYLAEFKVIVKYLKWIFTGYSIYYSGQLTLSNSESIRLHSVDLV